MIFEAGKVAQLAVLRMDVGYGKAQETILLLACDDIWLVIGSRLVPCFLLPFRVHFAEPTPQSCQPCAVMSWGHPALLISNAKVQLLYGVKLDP